MAEMGCKVPVDEFRRVLVEVKDEIFPRLSIDELVLTRDEAAYVNAVKKRVDAARLTRVFVLRSLLGTRKNPART